MLRAVIIRVVLFKRRDERFMGVAMKKTFKIVLLSPKGPMYRHRGGSFKKSLRYQPLTLTTLAALLPEDIPVELTLYDEGIETLPEHIEADLVGMTVITGNAKRAYELSADFRARGIAVAMGGPHITLVPEDARPHADCLCIGYGEETWPQLVRDAYLGRLQPEYRQRPDLVLDASMPFARRDLLPRNAYMTHAVFEATRSCVHDCEFCVAPSAWGRRQIQKPVEWVVEDIRRVGAKTNLFVDLNLVADRAYAKSLFSALIPLNIHWFGLSTVLIAHDQEMMELMARSGCRGLLLGLEALSQNSLDDNNKHFNASVDYKKLIQDLHHLNIMIQGCFVFGADSDTTDVFKETVDFALETGVDLPRFAVLTPFPGTPLFRRLESEGRIISKDWDLYDVQHVVFQPKNMTVQELEQGHERAWKEVYRYKSIAERLWRSGNFRLLSLAANFGYRFYAHNLHKFYNCDWHLPGERHASL